MTTVLDGLADEGWTVSAMTAVSKIAAAGKDASISFAVGVKEANPKFEWFMVYLLDPAKHARCLKSCTFLTEFLTVAQNDPWVYSLGVSGGVTVMRWGRTHV